MLLVAHSDTRLLLRFAFFLRELYSPPPKRMTELRPITPSSSIGNSAPLTSKLKDRGEFEQLTGEGEVSQLTFQLISKHSRLNLLIWVMKQLKDRSMEV